MSQSLKPAKNRQLSLFIEHLQAGGVTRINEIDYVWLDDDTWERHEDGDNVDRIDGLAMKMNRHAPDGSKTPHYMGADCTISELMMLVNAIDEIEWVGIIGSKAMRNANHKKRYGDTR